ncbi:flagellar hook-associated protein FlgK [Legionella worsleiensis]|uniref:Flagellar hook-associated protein 1 n=1 Tax=Legionella worsleiensis TaxID=45076 RepID=A0A0W1A5P4_9GAMM|nr:flagellar hook-associated protein FlgK [Legionella worsleiensis]KTD76673.1 flagellar hook-associated protein FlgK [Legionella worsleiensis]STY30417.1 flagellar hook-associated protein 1 FlgK [Legionella worsleiensis]
MSILNIASSGLNAFQRAFQVAGNNIVNATTKGYTRQSIQFTPGPSQRFAGSYIGSGVFVSSIDRNVDQFTNSQVRTTLSLKSQFDTFYQQAVQIDKLLSQDGTSISTSMQSFFDALGQTNSAPDSIASRGVTIKQSQLMVQQFNSIQGKLDEYQQNSTAQISGAVRQVNQLTRDIAALNKQLMSTPNSPELLDQRDELLKELSKFTTLTVFDQGDGTIGVGIVTGDMLVSGTEQRDMVVGNDNTRVSGTKVYLSNGSGQIDITSRLTTGMLGGLMDYENAVINQASQIIGQMAIGLAETFNAQHNLGMDLNNQIGKDFFNDYNSAAQQRNRVVAPTSNTGTGVISVAISNISQTQLSDYELTVTDAGTNEVRLTRKSDGTSTILNWTDTPPTPPAGQLVIDGMTISVDDTTNLANNDTFTLVPVRGAARDMSLQITDPREIALASPVSTSASLSNTGMGKIALGSVFNTTDVNKEYRIDFISDTQYNLVNVTDGITTGPVAFVPNTDNTVQIPDSLNPSYTVVLSGIPKSGDQFTATYNSGASGDNRNGLSLSAIQQDKILSNGTENLFDRYANLLAEVGGQTKQAQLSAESADVLYQQAEDFWQSKSGVNQDEEGVNLLKFKQAYEAAGKLLEISNQMMNTLFDMLR